MEEAPEISVPGESCQTERWTIYGIVDPEDRRVFFIGNVHGARSFRTGEFPKVDERIRNIRRNGAMPLFVVLEETNGTEAAERAGVYWVEVLKGRGNRLLNEGGYRPPPKVAKQKPTQEERREQARQRAAERGLPENTGQAWTEEQDRELTRLFREENMGGKELSDIFGRTRGAVAARLVKIGMLEERYQLQD